ncbi:MAG: hypothetical protein ABI426_11365 [Flavobacterium sp.]
MESANNELLQTDKVISIRSGMIVSEDLGTDNPDLKITITNKGPAREIEFFIKGDRRLRLQKGDTVTFRLGDYGKERYLSITNNNYENANVSLKW